MKKKKKKKSFLTTLLLAIGLLFGIALISYPTISNLWNEMNSSKVIESYQQAIDTMDEDELEKMWQDALEYNEALKQMNTYEPDEDTVKRYNSLLNINGDGVMGYIEIEKIDVNLPIYHGVEDATLEVAAGHLDWSSLPVGGLGTHCVLSGHRGLPGAKLFTDLDLLYEGDIFTLHILNQTLTYQIDQIRIVLPGDVRNLQTEYNMDFCTLTTCTPYGVNTHRMLLRAHRIENEVYLDASKISNEAEKIQPILVSVVVAIPTLLLILAIVLVFDRLRRIRNKIKEQRENKNPPA